MSEGVTGLFPDRGEEPDRPRSRPPEPEPGSPRRAPRRKLALAGIGALVVAGVGAAVATGVLGGGSPVTPPTPETVVLPSPTPTVAPIARAPLSPFADALPSGVLAYALTAFAEDSSLLVAGALEGYRLDYADGAGGVLTVLAGQWPTAEEAAAALAAVTAGATPVDDGAPASGEVLVDGAPVGTWVLTQAPDGTTSLAWTNGTALLRAVGPADLVRDVLAAYPL